MKVSIIVSDMDSQDMLGLNMHALCTQDFARDDYEVILPDLGNFSKADQALVDSLVRQYDHFHVLRGPGKNRMELINEGAKRSKGEILMFIESHIFLENDTVRKYVQLFDEDKERVAIQGGIKTVPTDSWVGQAQDFFFIKNVGRFKKFNVFEYYFDFHNSAMRRSCFDELGGFRDDLPSMGEFELGARLCASGRKIYRTGDIVGWHFNDNRLLSYAHIVGTQGMDRTRIFLIHGPKFMSKYFPQPKFMRLFPLVRRTRIIFLAGATLALYASMAGLVLTRPLRLKGLARFFFTCFAENSVRLGMIRTVNEWKKYQAVAGKK